MASRIGDESSALEFSAYSSENPEVINVGTFSEQHSCFLLTLKKKKRKKGKKTQLVLKMAF